MNQQFKEHEKLSTSRNWRVLVLHYTARALGVMIHIDGMPYGGFRIFRRLVKGKVTRQVTA